MNLQENGGIFLDETAALRNPAAAPRETSKVKQSIENAKKIDREIPYSISREAYDF